MFNRRKFLREMALVSGGVGLVSFLSCEDDSEDIVPDNNSIINPTNNSPSAPLTPSETDFEKYIPLVNDVPYFEREYLSLKDTSGTAGDVSAYYKSKIYNLILESQDHKLISGLEGRFYGEERHGTKMFSVFDSQGKYLPSIYSFSNTSGRERTQSIMTMLEKEEGDIRNGGIGSYTQDLFIKQIKDGLPSWDSDKMCDYPGMIYMGDWSFETVKNLNTNLNQASAVVTFVAPNPVSAGVFSVTSSIGKVLTGLDFLITAINTFTPLNINKDKQYSFYQIPFDPTTLLVSLGSQVYCENQAGDINDLLPLHPNNSWTFKDDSGNTAKLVCDGLRKVKDKNLLVVRNTSGGEEYFGFYGSSLYQYGIKDPSIGNIFFSPALKLGDNDIKIGNKYVTSNSKIISEKYSNIGGVINETLTCKLKEKLKLPNGKPYGDCFKMEEYFEMKITKDGVVQPTVTGFANHWYAKNVGKVKMEFEGRGIYLVDSLINTSSRNSQEDFYNPFSKKLIESIKLMVE